jgi:predicted DNA-binding protein
MIDENKGRRYIGGHIPSSIYDRIKLMAEKEQRPVVYYFKKFIEEGLERHNG